MAQHLTPSSPAIDVNINLPALSLEWLVSSMKRPGKSGKKSADRGKPGTGQPPRPPPQKKKKKLRERRFQGHRPEKKKLDASGHGRNSSILWSTCRWKILPFVSSSMSHLDSVSWQCLTQPLSSPAFHPFRCVSLFSLERCSQSQPAYFMS